ncbi:MAG: sigma 54-interacting transcriptional regulator [Akkermansia sp.]
MDRAEQARLKLSSLAGESLELRILSSMSRILVTHRDMAHLLEQIITQLQSHLGFTQGALCLLHDNKLVIEASYGLSALEESRGTYQLGEGITGHVGLTGEPAIIQDTTQNATFLNRTGTFDSVRRNSFICVPIMRTAQVVGTLSLSFPPLDSATLDKLKTLLIIVASIIADSVDSIREQMDERQLLERENDRMRLELGENKSFDNIIGHSSAMRAVYMELTKVARSDANVLLVGESGTGKELLAQAIHYASDRRNGPFVAVNCAALPEGLIESELFGHEKGAFTGAIKQRIGRFEEASTGTLFLDEIGDIPVQTQVKLLRVLQEKVFERVGSQQSIITHARIIAATSRDLLKMKDEGSFREDLYYRLAVLPITVPPLRSRRVDIISLADYFLSKYNKRYQKKVKRISTPAIDMLMSYHWPGNVRELENMIERAVIMSGSGVINAIDLPPSLQTAAATGTEKHLPLPRETEESVGLETLAAAFETELITESLKRNQGNVSASSRELRITLRKLNYKIQQLHIEPSQYR